MSEIFFKIRRKSDDLFSTGGIIPSFSKDGKMWRKKNHLKNHINNYLRHRLSYRIKENVYDDCEIVIYELVEMGNHQMDLETIQNSIIDAEKLRQKKNEEYNIKRDLEEFNKLKNKLGNLVE